MHDVECVHRGRRVICGAAWICGLAAALLPATAAAVFIVSEPWVRPSAGGAMTEAYMVLTSTEGATLVGARSDAASAVVIYAAGKRAAGIVRLPLPPGEEVRLGPDGLRLGLSGLVRSLKPGDRVALTLTIESADGARQEIPVNAGVHLRSPIDEEKRAHRH
jgi:copper(I)-binding protein